MKNKVYILKVLYNIRNRIDSKSLAVYLRKYWPEIINPWYNELIKPSHLQELFKMADRDILMDKNLKGKISIYRIIDLSKSIVGKSYCTEMESLIRYKTNEYNGLIRTENIDSKKILAYFADRDEVIIDLDDVYLYDNQLLEYIFKESQEKVQKI